MEYEGISIGGNIVDKKELCQRYAMKSVNSMLSSVNAFFVFMGWYDLKIKTLKIQKQIFAKDEKELTKDEYKRLLNAAKSKGNQKLFLLMQTICATGIRVSEIYNVKGDGEIFS